ncbi:Nif11 family protein [Candidatus Acetothermia bacterium]|nr:Nif11 family protein [Candidatus Acetothermia bacterium]MBI3643950.1 Nif11 family protein [Candidatus Acetothermia bacterium]
MSLIEVRRFRADVLKQPDLLKHVRSLHWHEVVELANAHGYAFTVEESFKYFSDLYSVALSQRAMTRSEIAGWKITGNPNALIDGESPAV